jgi:hypothetical protein
LRKWIKNKTYIDFYIEICYNQYVNFPFALNPQKNPGFPAVFVQNWKSREVSLGIFGRFQGKWGARREKSFCGGSSALSEFLENWKNFSPFVEMTVQLFLDFYQN